MEKRSHQDIPTILYYMWQNDMVKLINRMAPLQLVGLEPQLQLLAYHHIYCKP